VSFITDIDHFKDLETKVEEKQRKVFYTADAIRAAMTCVCLYQAKTKRLLFQNACLDGDTAAAFDNILMDETKQITHINFSNNKLSDKGMEYISKAIKANLRGDFRIVKMENNELGV
jgi:hypothetical protein